MRKWMFLMVCIWGMAVWAAPTDRYEALTGEEDDFEVIEREWKEARTQVPPLPKARAWQAIELDTLPDGQQAFLDLNGVELNRQDYVLRYWLLIRSNKGAIRATYEGLRCATKEYIVYAYGHPKRTPQVRRAKQPRWRAVDGTGLGTYRAELMNDVFCAGETPRSLREIKDAALGRYERNHPFNNWVNDD